jgi:hypothetical protein
VFEQALMWFDGTDLPFQSTKVQANEKAKYPRTWSAAVMFSISPFDDLV